jgi:hypothetical protein
MSCILKLKKDSIAPQFKVNCGIFVAWDGRAMR